MLQPNIVLDNVTEDGKTIVVRDVTGTYDAATNVGGYGTPNAARADLYGRLFVELQSNGKQENLPVMNFYPLATPFNTDTWTIKPKRDGLYRFLFVLAPEWDEATEYAPKDVFISDGKHYEAVASSLGADITDTDLFRELTKINDFDIINRTENTYYAYLPYLHSKYGEHLLKEEIVELAKEGLSKYDKKELEMLTWKRMLHESAKLEAAWNHFEKAGEYMDDFVRETKNSKHSK